MTVLFSGGAVFDGKGNRLDDHAVLVDGDRIAEVAPVAAFEGYAGERIDTTGGTLMPGLGDAHVHLCMPANADPKGTLAKMNHSEITLMALRQAQQTLRGGVTSVRDCGGMDGADLAVRDALKRGDFRGPTMHAAGCMICMTGGHGNAWGRVADGVDDVIRAVREQVHAGCDLVKIMATGGVLTPGVNPEDAHYSAEEMRAGIQEARRFHKRTASHAQGTEGILNAVRGGIHSIEHGLFMDEACVREMVGAGVYLVPTISALKNILLNRDNGVPAFIVEKTERVAEAGRRSFEAFHAAGGKVAMGTDAGTPYNLHGANANELAYLVEYGMTPTEALVCGTSGTADLMGLPDRGHLAAGAYADLLLVDGDPTVDITRASEPGNHRAVYKDGLRVD